ncbi:MAG: biliverdin-producing heme oxygenase [Burkholderiaceae bacterium]
MTRPDAELLPRLRQSTGPLHGRIEALLRLEAPMAPARYGRIVRGFHEFLHLWEQRVRFALPDDLHAWFDERRRSPFAERDIAALHLPDAPDLRASARGAQQLLRLDSQAAAFGALYVIEGSALGGQVLTPRLAAVHGYAPERGAAYFHGFGARTGAMWREFRLLAQERVGHDEEALASAACAAVQTFQALIATFSVLDTAVEASSPAPSAAPLTIAT